MDKAPTYQDLARMKAEESAIQAQNSQMNNAAMEAQSISKANPVLAEYMNRSTAQQGLVPAADYTTMATKVANSVPDQTAYSAAMVSAASSGQVPVEAVLSDESVLPEFRQDLLQRVNRAQGLGQLR